MNSLDLLVHTRVDPRLPKPLWEQLGQGIRQLIAAGALLPGDRLPSERTLVESLKISRSTVRLALASLEKDGLVSRTRGRGTVVLDAAESSGYGYSFTAEMRAAGREPSSRVLRFACTPANPNQSAALNVEVGTDLWEVRRLRLADGQPMTYHRVFIPCGLCPSLSSSDAEASIQRALAEKSGLTPASMDGAYEAIQLDATEARLLKTRSGAPALRLVRVNYTSAGVPYELAYITSRADRYKLVVHYDGTSASFRKALC
ncbi:GntR family transcriptional regulator [Olsenella sp. Marseille-P4559]|uniref:GntR family transcriptional regulator n=1 Tax=Olsenella sp. Marseille-P4559 TaxID=2364795 RepID=UPI0010309A3F|nr:GntR family transcriptional regulator [Olsenella sp. Marseille-P4559]